MTPPLISGVVVAETGGGGVENVEVRDAFALGDPEHPRRFIRLLVQQQTLELLSAETTLATCAVT